MKFSGGFKIFLAVTAFSLLVIGYYMADKFTVNKCLNAEAPSQYCQNRKIWCHTEWDGSGEHCHTWKEYMTHIH